MHARDDDFVPAPTGPEHVETDEEDERYKKGGIVDFKFYKSASLIKNANCCSRMMFSWSFHLVKNSRTMHLSVNDFGGLWEQERTTAQHSRLEGIYSE